METNLEKIIKKLDKFFEIKKYGSDLAMSKMVPIVFEKENFDWKYFFEKDFNKYFNGLMIRGDKKVKNIFCSVFPNDFVLKRFLDKAEKGDLLFLHHPINMECGDPKGKWGRGFLPINKNTLLEIKKKKLSIYSCHLPMDVNKKIGTNSAIIKSLKANNVKYFIDTKFGYVGRICEIKPIKLFDLIKNLKDTFIIPYIDFDGFNNKEKIKKIAIIAGCGDKIEYFSEAEKKGVEVYITGEIHTRIDNEKGHFLMKKSKAYAKKTKMSLIGVSHAASEYLVMKTQMIDFFKKNFLITAKGIPLKKWWQ